MSPLYTLVYLTSAWMQPMDATVLPKIRASLDKVNALNHDHQLIGLLEVYWISESDSSSDVKVQRLESSYATIIAVK